MYQCAYVQEPVRMSVDAVDESSGLDEFVAYPRLPSLKLTCENLGLGHWSPACNSNRSPACNSNRPAYIE